MLFDRSPAAIRLAISFAYAGSPPSWPARRRTTHSLMPNASAISPSVIAAIITNDE